MCVTTTLESLSERTMEVPVLQFYEEILDLVSSRPNHLLVVVLKEITVLLEWEAWEYPSHVLLDSFQIMVVGQFFLSKRIFIIQILLGHLTKVVSLVVLLLRQGRSVEHWDEVWPVLVLFIH